MKVLYDDNERETLRDIYDKYVETHLFGDFNPDKVYSINFKITDPEVAEYIFRGMLFNTLEDFDLGIKVTSINLVPYVDNYELKAKLHDAIDKIIH